MLKNYAMNEDHYASICSATLMSLLTVPLCARFLNRFASIDLDNRKKEDNRRKITEGRVQWRKIRALRKKLGTFREIIAVTHSLLKLRNNRSSRVECKGMIFTKRRSKGVQGREKISRVEGAEKYFPSHSARVKVSATRSVPSGFNRNKNNKKKKKRMRKERKKERGNEARSALETRASYTLKYSWDENKTLGDIKFLGGILATRHGRRAINKRWNKFDGKFPAKVRTVSRSNTVKSYRSLTSNDIEKSGCRETEARYYNGKVSVRNVISCSVAARAEIQFGESATFGSLSLCVGIPYLSNLTYMLDRVASCMVWPLTGEIVRYLSR